MKAAKYTPENTALWDSFCASFLAAVPAGVCVKLKRTDDRAGALYITNAPDEIIEWSQTDAGVGTNRRFCQWSERIATEYGRALMRDQLVPIAQKWSRANGCVCFSLPVYIGTPSRGFVPVAKDTRAPKEKAAPVGGSYKLPASILPGTRDARIIEQMHAAAVEVVAMLRRYDWADALKNYGDIRPGSNVSAVLLADNSPRVYDFEGFRVECAPADLPGVFHRYARAFGVRYTPAPVADFTPEEIAEKTKRANEARAARRVELEPAPVAAVVEVEPSAVVVDDTPAPAVEVEQPRPRVSFRKVAARLVVCVLSLIVAALRVVIACARLVERGRLVEVVADHTRARLTRVRSVVVRRLFVARGRIARKVEAVADHTRARLARACLVVVRRLFVARGRVARRVLSARRLLFDYRIAARMYVTRNARAVQRKAVALGSYIDNTTTRAGLAVCSTWSNTTARAVQLINAAAFVLIIAERRAASFADYIENI